MKRTLSIASVIILAVAATFASCAGDNNNEKGLLEHEWTLERITYADSTNVINAPVGVYIIFSDSSMVYGRGGCNNFFGRYETMASNQIAIDQVGSTMMLCFNQSFEDRFMKLLSEVTSYDSSDDKLILRTADDRATLEFRPRTPEDEQRLEEEGLGFPDIPVDDEDIVVGDPELDGISIN